MRQGPVWLGFAPNKWGQKWPARRQGRTEVPVLGDWSWSLRINDQQDQTGQTWAPAGTLNYTQPARHWTGITKQTVSLCLIHNKDLFAKIKSEPIQFSRLFDMVLIWMEQKAQYKWCTFKYDCQLNTFVIHLGAVSIQISVLKSGEHAERSRRARSTSWEIILACLLKKCTL